MKHIIAVIVLLTAVAAFAAADTCEGYWKSIDDDSGEITAFWQIYVKNNTLYGEIVRIADKSDDTLAENVESSYSNFPISGDLRKRTVINTPWIYGLSRRSEGRWRRGHIIDPEDGRRYGCEIIFHPADGKDYRVDTLEMRGKILFFSRSQYWERSSLGEAQSYVHSGS